jgi:hypothetical protein
MTTTRGPKGRSGAAVRRRPLPTTGEPGPRRRKRATKETHSQNQSLAPVAPLLPPPPAPDDPALNAQLQRAWAAASPELQACVTEYGTRGAPQPGFTLLRPHVQLAMLTSTSTNPRSWTMTGQVALWHLRARHEAGTVMEPAVLWQRDLVEQTIATVVDKRAGERSRGTYATQLRKVSRALSPDSIVLAKVSHGRPTPSAPYSTPELDYYFDWACSQLDPDLRRQLLTLLWLGLGVGAVEGDLSGMRGTDVVLVEGAVLVCLSGRWVPAHHTAEQALLELAAQVGDAPLFASYTTGVRQGLMQVAKRKHRGRRKFSSPQLRRLRVTWMALVTASGADVRALVTGSGVEFDKRLGALVGHLPALSDAEYRRALRGSDEPLPPSGLTLLPGLAHGAPQVPLRTAAPITGT